jgi:hypothetical protein
VVANRLYYLNKEDVFGEPNFITLEEIHVLSKGPHYNYQERLLYYIFKFFGTFILKKYEIVKYK